jgi:hypothetical protein
VDAYNVKLVDDDGKLLVDDPKVRAGLINALRDYTDVRTQRLHAAVVDDRGRTRTTTSPSTTRRS